MATKTIESEESLLKELERDLEQTEKKRIIFQAGHFPITYRNREAIEDLSLWGEFSIYSLELASRLASTARSNGKDIGFALIVDDRSYESDSQMSHSQRKSARNHLYKSRSGINATLPTSFSLALQQHQFSEGDVIKADHNRKGREDCLYFSEKILIAQSSDEKTECAKAYKSFIENRAYFNRDSDYLVSFIPDRCTGNICRGVLERGAAGLTASHIFMQTDGTLLSRTDRSSIWENWGALYRKDE